MGNNSGMSDCLLQIRGLTKHYGSAVVVDDLSFEIAPGECLGVIGPNGAGKTTTIRMCLGLTAPDAGDISYALSSGEGGLRMRRQRRQPHRFAQQQQHRPIPCPGGCPLNDLGEAAAQFALLG